MIQYKSMPNCNQEKTKNRCDWRLIEPVKGQFAFGYFENNQPSGMLWNQIWTHCPMCGRPAVKIEVKEKIIELVH